MGAINFSLDTKLVAALQSALPLKAFVETGTYQGDTVAALESSFDKVFSIELSESLCANAAKRFEKYSHIQILQGASPEKLNALRAEIQDIGTLFWLDAHWCAADATAGEQSQCPLLDELRAIGELNRESVVLIDDARLFLAPPLAPHEISQWPSFSQILSRLSQLSDEHELTVVNDVIVFFPMKARGAMMSYAQRYGVNWLEIVHSLKQAELLIPQLELLTPQLLEKEREIEAKEGELQTMILSLQEKQAVIEKQAQALHVYRLVLSTIPFLKTFAKILHEIRRMSRPRLGNLNQYPPRLLSVSRQEKKPNRKGGYPKISLVTPSFSQGNYIERTMLSIFDQQYPHLEYFIQDGGSKDQTVSVLKKYESRLSGWTSEKDGGQSCAINSGFLRTSGDIMGWVNSDDLLLPGALEIVSDYFNRHPEIDVVYGDRLLIDENDMEIGRWIMPAHDDKVLSWVDFVPQETLFWRRRIWDKVGARIDESFKFAMDWDLLVRFRDAGAEFAHIPVFLGAFRIHALQKTSAEINHVGYNEMNRIRERTLGRIPDNREIRKAILPFMLKHLLVDVAYRLHSRLGKKQ